LITKEGINIEIIIVIKKREEKRRPNDF